MLISLEKFTCLKYNSGIILQVVPWHFKGSFCSMILVEQIKLLKAEIHKENVRGSCSTRKLSRCLPIYGGDMAAKTLIYRDFAIKWTQTVKVEGRRVSSPPPEHLVKSAVHKEDVVVSAWFVGAQQGEAVSEMVNSGAVSLWLV